MKNFLKQLFTPKQKAPERVRTTDGKFARKVKIGGMYRGYFYMPAVKGKFKYD